MHFYMQRAVKYDKEDFFFNAERRQLPGSIMVFRALSEWITFYVQSEHTTACGGWYAKIVFA